MATYSPQYIEAIRANVLAQLQGLPQLQPVYDTSPQLAPQVFNPGNRGQNARYDVTKLVRGPDGRLTDGVWHYDEGGLSYDRPDTVVPGLPGAENMNNWGQGMPTPWVNTSLERKIIDWKLPDVLPAGYNPATAPRPLRPGELPTEADTARAKAWISEQIQAQLPRRIEWTGGRPAGVSQTKVRPISTGPTRDPWAQMAKAKAPVNPRLSFVVPPKPKNPYGTLGPSPARVNKITPKPQPKVKPPAPKPVKKPPRRSGL